MCEEAGDTVAPALLDHRGKLLEAESTFPYRLVQYFGLRGAKVFGAAAEFHSKDSVDFFTFPEVPRGENADACSSGVQTLRHYKVDRLVAFLMKRARIASRSFCFMWCKEVESAWLTGYSTPSLLKVPLVQISAV